MTETNCERCIHFDVCDRASRLLWARLGKEKVCSDFMEAKRWIPVTERLPERAGMPVLLVAVNRYGQRTIVKGFTNYECPVEFLTNEKAFDKCWHMWTVTHWMPLPEPPKEG